MQFQHLFLIFLVRPPQKKHRSSGGAVPRQARHRGPRALPPRRPPRGAALYGARRGVRVALLGRALGRPRCGGVRGGAHGPLSLARRVCGETKEGGVGQGAGGSMACSLPALLPCSVLSPPRAHCPPPRLPCGRRCASGPATAPTSTFGASSSAAAPCWWRRPRSRGWSRRASWLPIEIEMRTRRAPSTRSTPSPWPFAASGASVRGFGDASSLPPPCAILTVGGVQRSLPLGLASSLCSCLGNLARAVSLRRCPPPIVCEPFCLPPPPPPLPREH